MVNRGECLWNPTKVFVVCYCLLFWPWPCTKHNRCLLPTELLAKRNVSLAFIWMQNKRLRAVVSLFPSINHRQGDNYKLKHVWRGNRTIRFLSSAGSAGYKTNCCCSLIWDHFFVKTCQNKNCKWYRQITPLKTIITTKLLCYGIFW